MKYVLHLTDFRLQVPLDYSEPNGTQAAIALIRRQALEPEDSPSYRGPILFNPGGPGDSGVDMVLDLGETYATILGPQFDIVGFDPRGESKRLCIIEDCALIFFGLVKE